MVTAGEPARNHGFGREPKEGGVGSQWIHLDTASAGHGFMGVTNRARRPSYAPVFPGARYRQPRPSLAGGLISLGPDLVEMSKQAAGVLRQNSVRHQVIDLSALIRRRSRLNGHSPAPPASTPPDALRLPPSGRPGEPCLAPSARRLQADGDPAEVAQQRSTVLGRVV